MDLQLRGMNGLQAIRTIRSLQPDAKIVVLTMYEGDETIYDALEAGAVGYLLKDSVPGDLIRVIREVHAGLRSIPPHIEAKLEARIGRPKLTVRKRRSSDLLAQGMRNKEIAAELQNQRGNDPGAHQGHLPEAAGTRPHRGAGRSVAAGTRASVLTARACRCNRWPVAGACPLLARVRKWPACVQPFHSPRWPSAC
jgi:hypothetical protein